MRNVQHKQEAYWFYRFLSIFYDKYVNPFFWTPQMRDRALDLAELETPEITVIDVGSGTGFTTQGIASRTDAVRITCIDQSPHQMRYAKSKPDLRECTFLLGDAEELPFPEDHFDRYVSAGSIEYWPEPQRGITESYRILKPGGISLMIGPLRPQNRLGRWIADSWMLFPEEAAYLEWYRAAGFEDIQVGYVAPHWVLREKYGIAVSGRKPAAGKSPLNLPRKKVESLEEQRSALQRVQAIFRLFSGSLTGGLFIPMAIIARFMRPLRLRYIPAAHLNTNRDPEPTPLTIEQKLSIGLILASIVSLLYWIS